MTVGERIRKLRKELNMTQEEFARILGVSKELISKYEVGYYIPPDRWLRLMAHTFGVSYEWLKDGKGEMWKEGPKVRHLSLSERKLLLKVLDCTIDYFEEKETLPDLVKIFELAKYTALNLEGDSDRITTADIYEVLKKVDEVLGITLRRK